MISSANIAHSRITQGELGQREHNDQEAYEAEVDAEQELGVVDIEDHDKQPREGTESGKRRGQVKRVLEGYVSVWTEGWLTEDTRPRQLGSRGRR